MNDELIIRSEVYGVDVYFCFAKDAYIKRVKKGDLAFTPSELETLHIEKKCITPDIVKAVIKLKRQKPWVKILSFKDRRYHDHKEGKAPGSGKSHNG